MTGGAGNVFGRSPPSRPPPPPPSTSYPASEGDGEDGEDSSREKPTLTNQARAAAEEGKARARSSSSSSRKAEQTQRKARDLYETGDLEVDIGDGDVFDSLLGGKEGGEDGAGRDTRGETQTIQQGEEEGATWRRDYKERRNGQPGKSGNADDAFIEEIERLSRNGRGKGGPTPRPRRG